MVRTMRRKAAARTEAGSGGRSGRNCPGPARLRRDLRVAAVEPPCHRPRPQRQGRVPEPLVLEESSAQLRLGIQFVVEWYRGRLGWPRQDRPALDEDQLRGDGHERGYVPEAIALQGGQGIQIRFGEAAEGHGQDVELAGLDEGQQQRQRPVELVELYVGGSIRDARREGDLRRRCRARKDADPAVGRRPGLDRAGLHQLSSSAA